jgi:hypothetical protein
MSSQLIIAMMSLRDQIKIYHWETLSFPRHKATDELVTNLDTNIDKFVEVYIGKYGRPKFSTSSSIKLRNFHDKEATLLLKQYVKWLSTSLPKSLNKSADTDLLNIRDEILADLNQTLYLFTLH